MCNRATALDEQTMVSPACTGYWLRNDSISCRAYLYVQYWLEGGDRSVPAYQDSIHSVMEKQFTSLELCAGAGGQARGLEDAGFQHVALVEIDHYACETLRANRPEWNVIEADLNSWDPSPFQGKVDLLSGGVPCPPFSVAGKQLGKKDSRELFDRAIDIVSVVHPRGVMFENVRGLLDPKFDDFRRHISNRLRRQGYSPKWKLLQASDFGVPQLRPRLVCVALRTVDIKYFSWPTPSKAKSATVGEALKDLMAVNGWSGAERWALKADDIAPTLVGGSKKHGGADLGPTRSKNAWKQLGVDGGGIADSAPESGQPVDLEPKLTVRMAARLQGFGDTWQFQGGKTAAYRQVGNAFPPPVAKEVGCRIIEAWRENDNARE